LRFWNVEISLHFSLAFSQRSTSIYQAFDGQTEFSRVFNFAILSYLRNLRKFDAREKYVLHYMLSAHMLSHFRPSVRPSVGLTGGSVKNS